MGWRNRAFGAIALMLAPAALILAPASLLGADERGDPAFNAAFLQDVPAYSAMSFSRTVPELPQLPRLPDPANQWRNHY